MKTAIFAGSFDPVHYGHIDIITKADRLFDKVYWVLANNSKKQTTFTTTERRELMDLVVEHEGLKHVQTMTWNDNSALIDMATHLKADYLVRSFRMTTDFEYELQMAMVNSKLEPLIQTVYFAPVQEHIHVSSTIIRELLTLNKPLAGYMPVYLLTELI